MCIAGVGTEVGTYDAEDGVALASVLDSIINYIMLVSCLVASRFLHVL